METVSIEGWIAIVGIGVAIVIGVAQYFKNNSSKSSTVNINQSSGSFSKGKQKASIKIDQSGK